MDTRVISSKWVGKPLDKTFLDALRPDVDPSGENGEFHSFTYDGPIFKYSVPFYLRNAQLYHSCYWITEAFT